MTDYEKLSLKIQLSTITATVSSIALSVSSSQTEKTEAIEELNKATSDLIKEVVQAY